MTKAHLGRIAGIQEMLEKAVGFEQLILASSRTPPDLHNGPTGLTLNRRTATNGWLTSKDRDSAFSPSTV